MPGKLKRPLVRWRRSLLLAFVPLLTCAQPAPDATGTLRDPPRVSIIPRGQRVTEPHGAEIRVDVNVVLIPVTVTDLLGKPVLGLSSEAFQVSEDGVEQPLETHQTRLLERYRYLPRTDLPKAYRH